MTPDQGARRITNTRLSTEDGFPEVYPVLQRTTDADGASWSQVRIPMRPNGRIGWVRTTSLGAERTVATRLVVDKYRLRAILYRSGRVIWSSRVGMGASHTPTPSGRFWIRERIRVHDKGGVYGPWAFGTSAYSRLSEWPRGGVIGIHGTNQPNLIPGRPSHGCMRLPNAKIRRLARLLPVGTPLLIR